MNNKSILTIFACVGAIISCIMIYQYFIKPLDKKTVDLSESSQQDLDQLKYDIQSELAFVNSFDFELMYRSGIGTTTPTMRDYTGSFSRKSHDDAYDFECTSVNPSNPDVDIDMKMVLFKEEYITKIEPISAGYEVYVKIPGTQFEGQYTVILENYKLTEIIGHIGYTEKNPDSNYELSGGNLDKYENYSVIIRVSDSDNY